MSASGGQILMTESGLSPAYAVCLGLWWHQTDLCRLTSTNFLVWKLSPFIIFHMASLDDRLARLVTSRLSLMHRTSDSKACLDSPRSYRGVSQPEETRDLLPASDRLDRRSSHRPPPTSGRHDRRGECKAEGCKVARKGQPWHGAALCVCHTFYSLAPSVLRPEGWGKPKRVCMHGVRRHHTCMCFRSKSAA